MVPLAHGSLKRCRPSVNPAGVNTAGALLLVLLAPAQAGDAVDTRVSFTIADDDLMRGPSETTSTLATAGSPTLPNSDPNQQNRLPSDDYETRDIGFENLTHLVLYAQKPGFFTGLNTEAALVLRAQVLREKQVTLSDDGSYLKLVRTYEQERSLALTAFPRSADRFRLGYSYDLSWGGSGMFLNTSSVPGFKVDFKSRAAYAFLGAKTAVQQIRQEDESIEADTVWGVLGGGGVDFTDQVRVEGGGGYFYRGVIDKPDLRTVEGDRSRRPRWDALGGALQVAYHVGQSIGVPIDFRLYKNDPLQREVFFAPEKYGEGVALVIQSEVSVVGQTLQDPDLPTSTTMRWGTAADVTGRLKMGRTRLHMLAVYRDLGFIFFETPPPGIVDFPDGVPLSPELLFAAGADYYIESWYFTPGIVIGMQRPASYTSGTGGGTNPPLSLGQQTMLVRSANDLQPMDPGDEVKVATFGKITFRWDLSEILQSVGELQLSYDPNRRGLSSDPNGISTYVPLDPEIIGFNVMLRARF